MQRFDFSYAPFDTLSPDERLRLEACADILFYANEQTVLAPDAPVTALYVVIKGVVREMAGDEIVALYRAQDGFDARATAAGQTSRRFIVQEEALLYSLPRAEVLALTESNPRFGAYFYASVSEKLGRLAQRAGQRELQTLLAATVRDVGGRQPVFVDGGASLRDAAAAMKAHKSKSVLLRGHGRLGILTTTDFRDIVLNGASSDAPAAEYCQYELLTIDIDDFLFNALLLMTRRNLRRLVVTEHGEPVSMLAQVDVLSYFSNHSHLIAQRLERAATLDELAEVAEQIPRLVRILSGHGVKALQLGRLVQSLNARLFARAWRLIAPPELVANSCLLVLGSEGRGEQILKTDQDNALLLRDGAPWPQLEASCQAFSAALARFGYPPCPGNIMLSHPDWRFSGTELRDRLHRWVHSPDGDALMRLAIFVDAEAVCGDPALLEDAQNYLRATLRDDAGFFSRFARAIEQFDTPLGLFSHLQTRDRDGRAALDLKKGGIFPLVHGIRALALEYGVSENNSQQRLQELVAQGRLERGLAEDVGEALSYLMQLRLDQGLERLAAGKPADNLLEPEKLSSLERDLLKDTLGVVKRFKAQLRHHYRLGSF
ncbi:cyclic nucleotide-binding/CBS domain-containing protein [Chromobacterium haemolyticum]|uniref:Cyclic nucleotide-binding/CBS domain-containing protein n=3 Tax=Chromobacterium haemolyticum TaxID=394935 RepID=A0ABS3GN81_9NEIS|nr:putative nucleotidyltransferase substrate binding domain-containing protein [Chromobacterium haemolyticum]MBK0415269.1 cyclic nucleotide-binding/CBS domain-containing protein [Chromobacterium haemolyticum]MBO0416515.1 cyclic nucleotide-binding/CBS domain-containing protein [Chromobacterium haemolyticum]MBO0499909.1 cyclic nucleotide-binding/CBS domain-containing protein [Chromobacterium haemolyticum]